jgi:hypothetical protein
MPQSVPGYHLVLIYGVLALLTFGLAFTAITILGRRQWTLIGIVESLLARLCASAVLGLIAVGGLSGVVTSLIFPLSAPIDVGTDSAIQAARLQAEVGIVIALALTIAAVVRIESGHRHATEGAPKPEVEEWELDEPETIRRPR